MDSIGLRLVALCACVVAALCAYALAVGVPDLPAALRPVALFLVPVLAGQAAIFGVLAWGRYG